MRKMMKWKTEAGEDDTVRSERSISEIFGFELTRGFRRPTGVCSDDHSYYFSCSSKRSRFSVTHLSALPRESAFCTAKGEYVITKVH